jgi:hypothetical protein
MTKFFKNSKGGEVPISFTENEVVIVIDLLEFTAKLCNSLATVHREKGDEKVADQYTKRAVEAISLSDRFIEDSDPGKHEGSIH